MKQHMSITAPMIKRRKSLATFCCFRQIREKPVIPMSSTECIPHGPFPVIVGKVALVLRRQVGAFR